MKAARHAKTPEGPVFAFMHGDGAVRASLDQPVARKLGQIPRSFHRAYLRAVRGQDVPREAIQVACCECCGWRRDEVPQCTHRACPLWSYRPFVETVIS